MGRGERQTNLVLGEGQFYSRLNLLGFIFDVVFISEEVFAFLVGLNFEVVLIIVIFQYSNIVVF